MLSTWHVSFPPSLSPAQNILVVILCLKSSLHRARETTGTWTTIKALLVLPFCCKNINFIIHYHYHHTKMFISLPHFIIYACESAKVCEVEEDTKSILKILLSLERNIILKNDYRYIGHTCKLGRTQKLVFYTSSILFI